MNGEEINKSISFTENDFKALSYLAVGVYSEGSSGGRSVAYKLSFAGKISPDGVMHPVGNSGYSIGTYQTDLGQHREGNDNVPVNLIRAYQKWAREKQPDHILTSAQESEAIAKLRRQGKHEIKNEKHPHHDNLDIKPDLKGKINNFLRSDDGVTFIHNRDIAQVEKLNKHVFKVVEQTDFYKKSQPDDKIKLLTILAKTYNQNETNGKRTIEGLKKNAFSSLEQVKREAVTGYDKNGHPFTYDYMVTGVNHALKGAEVFMKLQKSKPDNPLNQVFHEFTRDPLANPIDVKNDVLRPQRKYEYQVIKNLFLHERSSIPFINALDQNATYSYGRAQPEKGKPATAGFFASDTHMVQWNRSGEGIARINNQWQALSRNDIALQKPAKNVVELSIKRGDAMAPLLHIDPSKPKQAQPASAGVYAPPSRGNMPVAPAASSPLDRLAGMLQQALPHLPADALSNATHYLADKANKASLALHDIASVTTTHYQGKHLACACNADQSKTAIADVNKAVAYEPATQQASHAAQQTQNHNQAARPMHL